MRPVSNRYEVRLALEGDEEGELVAFVQQKTFALKEDLRFYADEGKQQELFRVKARQRFDPTARYKVTAADGTAVGELAKAFRRSLARSTWRVFAPGTGEEVMWATERSLFKSLLRRVLTLGGFIPIVGDVLGLIPIRYHFDFFAGDRRIGGLERRFGIRDRYVLDVSGDAERRIDRRLTIALAVAMDTLQAR
ncbi:MAG TPA: hypothetical protein VFB51_00990 [Solirubrobacterales bacterium]|nr:hypothetical protein [Solirubrobacterales bacterium]